jgi:hypothetical protein
MSNQTKEEKLKSAYEYWQKNPHILVDDLVRNFKTNRRDLSDYLKSNKLGRPDGRVIGKGSPRQQAIKASYEAAIKANETPGWAERYARDNFDQKTDKGDFRYYAMKNDLPYLREVERQRQESPHKVSI